MTDGLLLPPGAGRKIQTMTLKAGADQSKIWSAFEAEVAPGFDVGAHLHQQAEEVFYMLEGELDLLAFHPAAGDSASGDWRTWVSETELADLLAAGGPPDQAGIVALRRRHDIHQLTPLTNRRGG